MRFRSRRARPRLRRKRRFRASTLLALLALLAGAPFLGAALDEARAGYASLYESEILRLKRIHIEGSAHSADLIDLVEAELKGHLGENILKLDLEALARRIESIPRIKSATPRRDLPDQLTTLIVEREPMALIQIGARAWVIDSEGALLGEASAEEEKRYPTIVGAQIESVGAAGSLIDRAIVERAGWALELFGGYRPLGSSARLDRIDLSRADRTVARFSESAIELTIPLAKSADILERLLTVDYIARSTGASVAGINLLFPGKVVITSKADGR